MYPLNRFLGVLLTPKTEWPAIRDESLTNMQIFLKYQIWVSLLAAAGYLLIIFRTGDLFFSIRAAIIGYLVALASVDLSSYFLSQLAPRFNALPDLNRTLKLMAFGASPLWLTSILVVLPIVGTIVWLAGLGYMAYLLNLGLPELSQTPDDKLVAHTATATIVFLVTYLLLSLIAGAIFGVNLLAFLGL